MEYDYIINTCNVFKVSASFVILYCTAYHPILFGSFNMFKILLLALSTSVQDFAILLQS